ncbi:MAG TPA: hypothetical protein VFJ97_00500 [Dermatophilaceae bacterium]|nr:hypothetical protein [Dermatophilaceae bacterium]
MDEQTYTATRRSLHGVAELVIAGPQYRAGGGIKLRSAPGGFAGRSTAMRVEGVELVWDGGRLPLTGSCRSLAAAAGLEVGAPGNYPDASGVDPDEPLAVDASAARVIADWFALGDAACRRLAPEEEPVLWPEHFDLGVAVDEVNYGVSPGDADQPRPYAYVGPWTQRAGAFWNAPFGALRWAEDLPDGDALVGFFELGRRSASSGEAG